LASLNLERVRVDCQHIAIGSDLRYFPQVDSTNRVARDLPPGSWKSGTVILTDYQRAGRGRRDRTWLAPAGTSLLLSVLLEAPARALPADSTMMAALATADAIRDCTGLDPALKWPNDLLLCGCKVCGILTEHAVQNGINRLIVGIGINVNFDPTVIPNLPPRVTSLQCELGQTVNREGLLAGLFKSLDLWYGYLTWDPDSVYAAWAGRLETVANSVVVSDASGSFSGRATGVRRDGALLVRDDEGETHVVYAADVSVRQLERPLQFRGRGVE
jgi:BirA family biotin operon repressor/biotin-[acetyl-CoA-carboxylase] ligase